MVPVDLDTDLRPMSTQVPEPTPNSPDTPKVADPPWCLSIRSVGISFGIYPLMGYIYGIYLWYISMDIVGISILISVGIYPLVYLYIILYPSRILGKC